MLFWTIILLIILLLLSGFFSGVEVALVSISRLKLRTLLKQKKTGAKALEELKKNPRKMIITILIGNNIVNISASVLATIVTIELFGSTGAGIAIGVMTFLVLVIGEITPKAYATTHYVNIALNVAKPILILSKILSPIVIFLEWIAHLLLKIFGGHEKKKLILTEEELKMAFDMGFEDKTIDRDEKKLLKNVLKFDDIAASEVMTLKKEMFCLNADMKVKEAIPLVAKNLYSRIPLYENSINKIIGVVNIKDIFEAVNDSDHDLMLREIGVRPLFIQSNLMLDDIFKIFQEMHTHIAIVRNKQKQIVGLVTIEDLLEELVGEIIDESDVSPGKIMRLNKKTILVDGETAPAYIKSFFHVNIPVGFKTISDYLIDYNKGMPVRGKKIKIDGISFLIEEVGEKYIERVLIKKIQQ